MNKLYELVLWDAGDRKPLGYFKTKKEAVEAMRLVKKYYAMGSEKLQDRLKDGDAGYEIIPHDYGFTESTGIFIRYYQDKIEPKEGA
jgi:hypothetical protein